MKEFRVEIAVRNNNIIEHMRMRGYKSVAALCRNAGLNGCTENKRFYGIGGLMADQKDLFGGDFSINPNGDIHKGTKNAILGGTRAQDKQDRIKKKWSTTYKEILIMYIRTFCLDDPGHEITAEAVMNWAIRQGHQKPNEGRATGMIWRYAQDSEDNIKKGYPAIVHYIGTSRNENPDCNKGHISKYTALPDGIPEYIKRWGCYEDD